MPGRVFHLNYERSLMSYNQKRISSYHLLAEKEIIGINVISNYELGQPIIEHRIFLNLVI